MIGRELMVRKSFLADAVSAVKILRRAVTGSLNRKR
jgi:hypothetical protein